MAFGALKPTPGFYPSVMDETAGRANKGLYNYGAQTSNAGYSNLYNMLLGQGRVDPRLLASAQAANSRSTQSQMDAARASASRGGFGGGGIASAIQGALGSAGASRAANLNYQDISDSYARNQENLGLLNQLVVQPGLANRQLGLDYSRMKNEAVEKYKNRVLGFSGQLLGAAGNAFGA